MCGLCGFVLRGDAHDARSVERLADELLAGVDHRGGDATGYLAIDADGAPMLIKAPLAAARFCSGRPSLPRTVRGFIGHTRMATQGAREWGWNNHPVRVGDTYLAHNGHVWNQREVREGLTRKPFAEVDSALLAGLADQHGPEGVLERWQGVEGAAAVTYWAKADPDLLVLARISDSPLYVWEGKRAIVWASTPDAVRKAWTKATGGAAPPLERVRPLSEGDAVLIRLGTGAVERRTFKAPDHWRQTYRYTAPLRTPKVSFKSRGKAPKRAKRGGGTGAGVWLPKGKGGATASPTPALSIVRAEGYGHPWSIIDGAETEGVPGRCDGCDYWETVTAETIGGETFAMCASCADWARRVLA